MKKYSLFAAVAMMVASCSSDNDMLAESAVQNQEPTQVTLTFSPYQMEAMTRADHFRDLTKMIPDHVRP